MTVAWRTLLVTGTIFTLANIACSWVVWLTWPALAAALRRVPAAGRARITFAWRTAPTGVAAAVALATGLAFGWFEPATAGERTGVTLVVFALAGASMALLVVVRAVVTMLASERLARAWTTGEPALTGPLTGEPAWAIDSDFPIVAVVGIWRPRLVVARSVVERCTPQELAAIVAHEGAHVVARDNLRRLWLQSAVDTLSWSRRATRMARAWQDAAEDAADDRAAAAGTRAVDLASALVTVAKLAPGRSLTVWPMVACFYRGGGLERRVHRILAEDQPALRTAGCTWAPGLRLAAVVAALVCVAAARTSVGHSLYAAAEWMVQTLP